MTRQIDVGAGDLFMVADRTILATEVESVLADVAKIGMDEHQLAYLFTFTGKVNNADETTSVTVAMSPTDAYDLAENILAGLRLLLKHQREGGAST